jgi:hypothetical protein
MDYSPSLIARFFLGSISGTDWVVKLWGYFRLLKTGILYSTNHIHARSSGKGPIIFFYTMTALVPEKK